MQKYPFVDSGPLDKVIYAPDGMANESIGERRCNVKRTNVKVYSKSRMIQAFQKQKKKEERRRFEDMNTDMEKIREDKLRDKMKRIHKEHRRTKTFKCTRTNCTKPELMTKKRRDNKWEASNLSVKNIVDMFYEDKFLEQLLQDSERQMNETTHRDFDLLLEQTLKWCPAR